MDAVAVLVWIPIWVGIASLLVAVYATFSTWSTNRRKEKAIIAGKDKTALEEMAASIGRVEGLVTKLVRVVFDRPASDEEPDGHAGLVSLSIRHDQMLQEQGAAIQTLKPNGGNTDQTGDIVLKLGKHFGVLGDDAK